MPILADRARPDGRAQVINAEAVRELAPSRIEVAADVKLVVIPGQRTYPDVRAAAERRPFAAVPAREVVDRDGYAAVAHSGKEAADIDFIAGHVKGADPVIKPVTITHLRPDAAGVLINPPIGSAASKHESAHGGDSVDLPARPAGHREPAVVPAGNAIGGLAVVDAAAHRVEIAADIKIAAIGG